MTNFNLTVNMQNVFVLIETTMIFVSVSVLYWALSNLSIKKTIPGVLVFIATMKIGVWASIQNVENVNIGGIRNYFTYFGIVSLILTMLQLLHCLFYSYRMADEKVRRIQNASILFVTMAAVILTLTLILK